MAKTSLEKIEEIAESLTKGTSSETMDMMVYHAKYVFEEDIIPELKNMEMESTSKKAVVRKFNHYNSVLLNIIGTMYVEIYRMREE